MPHIVVLLFDKESEEKLLNLCRVINGSEISFARDSCTSPHITIAMCDRIDEDMYAGLRTFAASKEKFSLRFESVGLFPAANSTIFLAPVVTDELLKLHKEFYDFFSEGICSSPSPQYLPNQWVPHCTVATGITAPETVNALKAVTVDFAAFEARIEYMGIAEYSDSPVKPMIERFKLLDKQIPLNEYIHL